MTTKLAKIVETRLIMNLATRATYNRIYDSRLRTLLGTYTSEKLRRRGKGLVHHRERVYA